MSTDQILAAGFLLVAVLAVAGMCAAFFALLREARIEARRTAQQFRQYFPGRCMICSYHQYGVHMGHIDPDVTVEQHHCIEKSTAHQHH